MKRRGYTAGSLPSTLPVFLSLSRSRGSNTCPYRQKRGNAACEQHAPDVKTRTVVDATCSAYLAAPQRPELVQQLLVRQRRHLHRELAPVAHERVRPLRDGGAGGQEGVSGWVGDGIEHRPRHSSTSFDVFFTLPRALSDQDTAMNSALSEAAWNSSM